MKRLLDHAIIPAALGIATVAVVGTLVAQAADALAEALWAQVTDTLTEDN